MHIFHITPLNGGIYGKYGEFGSYVESKPADFPC
jgi:hypothetical protein